MASLQCLLEHSGVGETTHHARALISKQMHHNDKQNSCQFKAKQKTYLIQHPKAFHDNIPRKDERGIFKPTEPKPTHLKHQYKIKT
jgi:hypothetical protein